MTTPRPARGLTTTLSELPGSLVVAAGSLGIAGVTALSLQEMTGPFDRYAQFGPHDGLASWLLVGLVAWTFAFVAVRRRRRTISSVASNLFGFLGVHALIFLLGLAAVVPLAAFAGAANAVGMGCLLGFFLLLPLGFLSPWAAARGLLAQEEPGSDPFTAALWGWASLLCHPVAILKGAILNLVLLFAAGFPVYSVLEQGRYSGMTWLGFWFGLLVLGATHVQFDLAALAAAEGRA